MKINADIIIPLYNEEKILKELLTKLNQTFLSSDIYIFNFIFVNDGSTDKTLKYLNENLKNFDINYKILNLSRNFGHQSAITAGLTKSVNQVAITMDGDLQDPPETVFEMLNEWKKGNKIVYAKRRSRKGESLFKLFTAKAFYKIIKFTANVEIPPSTGDFRLIDKSVVKELNALPEKNRFIRGLIPWLGFQSTFVEYDRNERIGGETKYTLQKMVRLAIDGISSFSILPIRLCSLLGFLLTLITSLLSLNILYNKLINPDLVITGWSSVMVTILFLGGVQLLFFGVIGEYIGKIYDEVKSRPTFIIENEIAND